MSVAGTQAGKLAAWHGQAAASVVSRCDLARHVAWPRWCADRVRRPGPLTSAALAGADGDGSRLAVARVRGDDQSRAPAGGDAGGEPFGGDAPLERWVHAVRERALPPTGAHFSGPIQGAPGRGRWGDCWKVGYAACEQVIVVCDSLNTHTQGAFDEVFDPERARRLVRRFEFRHTPNTAVG